VIRTAKVHPGYQIGDAQLGAISEDFFCYLGWASDDETVPAQVFEWIFRVARAYVAVLPGEVVGHIKLSERIHAGS
jgi:hypothetical protein